MRSKPGPKPPPMNEDAQEALAQEFEAAARMAREARAAMAREGAAVRGSKGNIVLSPHARVWQMAVNVMKSIAPRLDPDVILDLEDEEEE